MPLTIPAILLLAMLLFPSAAPAHHLVEAFGGNEKIGAAVGLESWISQADAKWQISFPHITKAGASGTVESRLDFRKIDSPIVTLTGSGAVTPQLSFDVKLGYGPVADGRGADTDRFISTSDEGGEFSQSRSSINGEVRLWGVDFTFDVSRDMGRLTGVWAVVLGFLHYEDSLRMTDGVQTVSVPFDGVAFPPPGPFSGLDSSYSFSWNTFKAGILQRAEITKSFSYSVALSFFPVVLYRGDGYWNLRAGTEENDFRVQSPNFVQQAKTGYGYDADAGLVYSLNDRIRLLAGYRMLSLSAYNGTDRTYFSGASAVTEVVSKLDWVMVFRHGAYAGLMVGF